MPSCDHCGSMYSIRLETGADYYLVRCHVCGHGHEVRQGRYIHHQGDDNGLAQQNGSRLGQVAEHSCCGT